MSYKPALIRGLRTFLQGCLATLMAFYLVVKGDGTFVSIEAHGAVLLFGFFLAFVAGLISVIQNFLEDRSTVNIPKG